MPEELVQGVLAFLAERGYPDAQAVHSAEESLIFALPKELRRDLKAAARRTGLTEPMARYLDVHPDNPQPRLLDQIADALRDDALIAYPTDSGYALGCRIGNRDGRDRILRIRGLDDKHHFTLVCKDFAQLGQLVHVDNSAFRAIKAATPGPVHVHPARRRPRCRGGCCTPKKRTVGVRIPDHTRGPGPARGARRAAADQHPDPSRRGRAPDLGLGDQGGARPPGRHRDRGRRDPGRADDGDRLVGRATPRSCGAGPATRTASRLALASRGCLASGGDPLPDGQDGQAEHVARDQGAAVVGEPGHDGLDDAVLGCAITSGG